MKIQKSNANPMGPKGGGPWGSPMGPGESVRAGGHALAHAPPCSPPMGPHAPGPPMGPPHGALFPENLLPPSRPWGPHGAPDLWSICLIYIEICSFSWISWIWQRFKWVLWLKYCLYKIFWKIKVKNFEIWDLELSLRRTKKKLF